MDTIEKRFGMTAIQKGYITIEELTSAVRIQLEEALGKRSERLIVPILMDQGLMTYAQVSDVLRTIGLPGSNQRVGTDAGRR